jgi:putative serine protease PepD
VRAVARDLEAGRRVSHPYLGVATAERTNGDGAVVRDVVPNGPAADAGLRTGDVITRIGATTVRQPGDVSTAVLAGHAGDRVGVTVSRGGRTVTLQVRLGEQPRQAP